MMVPSLPQHDRFAERRAKSVAEAREEYRYTYAWPPGVATAESVPRRDDYSLGYVAALLPISWELFTNTLRLAEQLIDREGLERFFARERERTAALEPRAIGDWFLKLPTEIAAHVTAHNVRSLEIYDTIHQTLPAPPAQSQWNSDAIFAWQRLAGVNPMTLRRVDALPAWCAITADHVARAGVVRSSLASALSEGRAFACDYSGLYGVRAGVTKGRSKALPAPYALFIAEGGALIPVAIQLAPVPDARVCVPSDGDPWTLARIAVNIADANEHETVQHLGRTHMVMEAVTLAMKRQLASDHPLRVLLEPHTEFTLAINHSAATNLIAPNGVVDEAFGAHIDVSASLVRAGLDSFDLRKSSPRRALAARGVDDRSVIEGFAYRDDASDLFPAYERFAEAYVRIYYGSDQDVVDDHELQAFVQEISSQDGGRVPGVGAADSVASLSELLAIVLWTGTAQHAAVNFTQYPFMGAVPNMAGAFWSEWPPADLGSREQWLALLPPYNLALEQIYTVYQLSSVRLTTVGKYSIAHFVHPPARAAVEAFERDLEGVERALSERDRGRWMSYPYLFPSRIPQSIHI